VAGGHALAFQRLSAVPSYGADLPASGTAVQADEALLRWVRPKAWGLDGRPTIAAFSIKPDEDGLSIFVAGLVEHLGLETSAVVEDHPYYGVVSFPRALPELAERDVIHKPVIPAQRAVDPAHAIVVPLRTGNKAQDKAHWQMLRGAMIDASTAIIEPSSPSDNVG
jgi:hypothetical protein